MKGTLLLIAGLGFASCLFGQNRELKGTVLYQNSGKKPAVKVKIMGQGANPDYSTSSGQFQLVYANKGPGDPAGLSVGSLDRYNTPVELVNTELVNNTRIPSEPKNDLFIFVCKAGQLAEAKTHYYNLCDSSLRKKYGRLIGEKEKLLAKANTSEKEKGQLQAQLDTLRTNFLEALNKLDNLSGYMAAINKDFASDMVKAAMDKMEKEQDIEGALRILDDAKLDEAYRQAMAMKAKAESEIEKVTEGYTLKINLLLPQFRYKEAIKCYEKVLAIEEENKADSLQLILHYLGLASAYNEDGKYTKTIAILIRTRDRFDFKKDSLTWSVVENNLGDAYLQMEKDDSSLYCFQQVLRIREKILDKDDLMLGSIYDNLGAAYRRNNLLDKALEMGNKGIALRERILKKDDPKLAVSYHNTSLIYFRLVNLPKALELENKSIAIKEKILRPDDPGLASSYLHLSLIQYFQKDNVHAIRHILKAKAISEKTLDPLHRNFGSIYDQLGRVYAQMSVEDSAAYFFKKAVDIYVANDDSTSGRSSYGDYLDARAVQARQDNKYMLAIQYLDTLNRIYKPKDLLILFRLGTLCFMIHRYDSSANYYRQAEAALEPAPDNQYRTIIRDRIFYALAFRSYYRDNDYVQTLHYFDSLTVLPDSLGDLTKTALCYYQLKKYTQAIRALKQVQVLDTLLEMKGTFNVLGMAYAKNNQLPEAEQAFKSFEGLHLSEGVAFRNWAAWFALKKDKDKALDNLDKAIANGYADLDWILTDDSLEYIRNEPRFKELVKKLKEKG
ncbi:tetratricopeptide repeat protein [Flavitalea flava]